MKSTKYEGLSRVQKAVKLVTNVWPHGVEYDSRDGSVTVKMKFLPSPAERQRIRDLLDQPVDFRCEDPPF